MPYFSGQGNLYVATRDSNGNAQAFRHVGNVPDLKVSVSTDVFEHKESTSGNRITDLRLTKENKCEVTFTLEEFSAENLALGLYGTATAMTGSTVTNETFTQTSPAPAVGDYYRTKFPNISAVTVKDSTGSPKTLTNGTNYSFDAVYGTIKLLDLTTGGAYVAPYKVDYTYTATGKRVLIFGTGAVETWLRFEGLNTADGNKKVLIELYRCLLDPAKELSVISDEINRLELTGGALYDATKIADAQLGAFGRIVTLA